MSCCASSPYSACRRCIRPSDVWSDDEADFTTMETAMPEPRSRFAIIRTPQVHPP